MNTIAIRCALACLLVGQAVAQDGEAPAERYRVEILLFRHLDQSRTTAEIPRPPDPEIDELLDRRLARLPERPEPVDDPPPVEPADDAANGASEAAPRADEASGPMEGTKPPPFREPVPDDELLLADEAERLRELDSVYKLLGHLAWVQPAPAAAGARAVELAELGVDPAVAAGEITLFSKRYLHLSVDIALGGGESGAVFPAPDSAGLQFLPVDEIRPAISDSRRVRLDRLTYFDQPEFGVLAIVRKVEAGSDAADTDAPGDTA